MSNAKMGTMKVTDRSKLMNRDSRPRFVAFVSCFDGAYEASGEGDTKLAARNAAIAMLPTHIRRHFTRIECDTCGAASRPHLDWCASSKAAQAANSRAARER